MVTIQEKQNIVPVEKNFILVNGQLLFLDTEYTVKFSDIFYVKVGAVSGNDELFIKREDRNHKGLKEWVYSKTQHTGEVREMYYFNDLTQSKLPDWVKKLKNKLKARKVKNFTDKNWWHWGRGHYDHPEKKRIYVNCKTRHANPFFVHSCKDYDGSVLAIFPNNKIDVALATKMLNKVNWAELGFMCNNRFIFSQKSLENTMLPKEFEAFLQ